MGFKGVSCMDFEAYRCVDTSILTIGVKGHLKF